MHRSTGLGVIAAALAAALTACDKAQEPPAQQPQPAAHGAGHSTAVNEQAAADMERRFLSGMVPHHEMAVEMARIAQDRAAAPELKDLAQGMLSAQTSEIAQMQDIHRRLFNAELVPDMHAAHGMGMSMEEAGMEMDAAALTTAEPFDQAFIDMMIPHHQGAIRMARVLLEDTQDDELRRLGEDIITVQSAEIEAMNALREKLYGAPSPAGGVPSAPGGQQGAAQQ